MAEPREFTYLERPRDGDKTIRAEILESGCIDGHQIDDVSGCTPSSIIRKYESLAVDSSDQPCANTHPHLEGAVEVLDNREPSM